MDETIIELLSRHLDGDLDPGEEQELAASLEAEPLLAARLEAMRSIRHSVTKLADRESIPSELDAVVEPLLRAKPEPFFVRPWVRWLATAAVVVLGLTVVIEVNRRNPGPDISSIARMSDKDQAETPERFTLAPLPTSSLPPEQQPLGASDRLLASPIPEVELEEPRPLDVLGPLEKAPMLASEDDHAGRGVAGDSEESATVLADVIDEKNELQQTEPGKAKRDRKPSASEEGKGEARDNDRGAGIRSLESGPARGRARLFVFIDGESAWSEFTPSAPCKPGRYSVRVVVGSGVVREARPVGGAASASPTQRLCAANLVINLEMDDVPDGEYPAEVVVETRGSGG